VYYSEISQNPELEVLLILKFFKNLEWAVRCNKIKELPNTSGNPAALVVPDQLKQLFNPPYIKLWQIFLPKLHMCDGVQFSRATCLIECGEVSHIKVIAFGCYYSWNAIDGLLSIILNNTPFAKPPLSAQPLLLSSSCSFMRV
jgi:hypothetical protein